MHFRARLSWFRSGPIPGCPISATQQRDTSSFSEKRQRRARYQPGPSAWVKDHHQRTKGLKARPIASNEVGQGLPPAPLRLYRHTKTTVRIDKYKRSVILSGTSNLSCAVSSSISSTTPT